MATYTGRAGRQTAGLGRKTPTRKPHPQSLQARLGTAVKAAGGAKAISRTPVRAGRPSPTAPARPRPNLGGGQGPAPAPQARAAQEPVGQHMEPDALYNNVVDLADRKQTQRLGELSGQERELKFEFGIDDPTNPFSRAEGLKRSYLARQKAVSAGLASQGQLYSGAHERAVSRTRRQEEEARAELRRAYESGINTIGSARAGVKFETEEQKQQAFEDWLARAPRPDVPVMEEDLPVEETGGVEAPASGGGGAPSPAPAPRPPAARINPVTGGVQAPPPKPRAPNVAVQSGRLPSSKTSVTKKTGTVVSTKAGLGPNIPTTPFNPFDRRRRRR